MKLKTKKSSRPRGAIRAPASGSLPGRVGRCSIVGVGASAGGLEAFTQLLKHLPTDTGFGFVLVQHLDPQHESALSQLLARATSMPVHEATHNLRVRANHVYIIPPNSSLGIARGVLKLQPRSRDRTALRSIDHFFEALANDQRERAIGVILSGTATDGTLGLEAIKAEGGLTFAQDDTARYDSMPRNAVVAGCVDLVLSPRGIAQELARVARHPYVASLSSPGRGRGPDAGAAKSIEPAVGPEEAAYQKILLLLRRHSGVDFSLYKTTTIRRRITRRTVLSRHTTLADYAGFLRGNDKELDALYADALINVTSFFRNAEAFSALQQKVFPRLLQERSDEALRVWVLGCSTGQEAYSIAMAFAESADKVSRARKLQVFATDLNEANLVKARRGFYPKSIAQDVSPERLRRFFIEEDGGYRVIKPLRDQVVFARQNVISDPPFSRMDLISCRNVIIYLEPGLQKKVFPTFHYALKPGGYLLLGASESIGGFAGLFECVDKRQKIFSRKAATTLAFQLPLRGERAGHSGPGLPTRGARALGTKEGGAPDALRTEPSAEREADRVTVSQFAPPGVLIDSDLQILQFRGSTGAYLTPPTGKPTCDLLKMVRDGLMRPLRAAINRAKRDNRTTREEKIPLTEDGRTRTVNLEVVPLKNLKERCFLILFEEAERGRRNGGGTAAIEPPVRPVTNARGFASEKTASARIASLEHELADARDYLQSVLEYQEAANEELQAANEEGQSANEELQSLNEELETSKEELESTNEELITVNEEMANRNLELNRLNSDLTNVEASTKIVIVLLGRDLTVRRFSAQAGRQFNLRASDVGRPIGEVRHNVSLPSLENLIADVIARVHECEREVQDHNGHWYLLRVRPYVTVENKVDGAVLVLVDIDDLKRAERLVFEAQSAYADKLEKQVAKRTAELTAVNRRLEASVDKIKKEQDKYRTLFLESEVMHKRLRHLTHEIIRTQEEERKAISRELHDEVVQTLVGINVELSALRRDAAMGGPGLQDKITHTQKLVEDSVHEVHRFARGLRPSQLDDLGLVVALHAHCKNIAAKEQLVIKLTACHGLESLGEAEQTVLFRVAQEALSNVVRHAHAGHVRITINRIKRAIRMEIADDGKSFVVEKNLWKPNSRRLGLVGMRERIEMVGGRLTIESAPGTGTTVRAEVPFPSAAKK